jgi:hypothetical protein
MIPWPCRQRSTSRVGSRSVNGTTTRVSVSSGRQLLQTCGPRLPQNVHDAPGISKSADVKQVDVWPAFYADGRHVGGRVEDGDVIGSAAVFRASALSRTVDHRIPVVLIDGGVVSIVAGRRCVSPASDEDTWRDARGRPRTIPRSSHAPPVRLPGDGQARDPGFGSSAVNASRSRRVPSVTDANHWRSARPEMPPLEPTARGSNLTVVQALLCFPPARAALSGRAGSSA